MNKKLAHIATALVALVAATGVGAREPSAAERAQLKALADATDVIWNAGDAVKLAEAYTSDSSLVLFPRTVIKGQDGIKQYFTRSFAQRPPKMRHVTRMGEVEMLNDELALVDGHVRLEQQQDDGSWKLIRYFVNHSVVARQKDGKWLLRNVRAHVKPDADVASMPAD